LISFAAGLSAVALFAMMVRKLGLVRHASRAGELSRNALAVLRNPQLSDDQKEAAMRSSALSFGGIFLVSSGGLLLSAAVPAVLVFALDRLGILSFLAVLEELASTQMIMLGTALSLIVLFLPVRRRGNIQ
jgi:hypothetical protein